MGWSIATYAGTRMTGSPSNYRTAMFELCRAVNERQTAIAITLSTFYKYDGTLVSNPTMADLLGLHITGTSSRYCQNMQKIQDAILAMINAGYFTESSGRSDTWTVANIETALGVSISDSATKANEARWWQAMQDTLDLLIYAKRRGSNTVFSGHWYYKVTPSGSVDADAAWSAMYGSTEEDSTGFNIGVAVRWRDFDGGGASNFFADAYYTNTGMRTLKPGTTGTCAGTLTDIDYILTESYTGLGFTDIDLEIGHASPSSFTHTFGSSPLVRAGNTADVSLTANADNLDFRIATALSTLNPFTGTDNTGDFTIGCPYTDYYFDIAAELTDQA